MLLNAAEEIAVPFIGTVPGSVRVLRVFFMKKELSRRVQRALKALKDIQ